MDALGADFTIACPAFPENGRTVFKGHLFVGDVLLSDSGMRNHPLTPMTDANLVRVLQAQCTKREVGLRRPTRPSRVGARARDRASASPRCAAEGVGDRRSSMRSPTTTCARSARRSRDLPLVTRGLRRGDRPAGRTAGIVAPDAQPAALPPVGGLARHRLGQLLGGDERAGGGTSRRRRRRLRDRPAARSRPDEPVAEALGVGARARCADGPGAGLLPPPSPPRCARCRQRLGVARAGALVERALARDRARAGRGAACAGSWSPAARPRARCVQALGVARLRIGPQIDPGVPWCHAAPPLAAEGAAPGAEVGQLRQRRLLHRGLRSRHERSGAARRDLPRRHDPVRARLRARHRRQHQRARSTTAS